MSAAPPKFAYDRWKRIIDGVSAAALLIVLSPVLLLVALAVRVRIGSPVIFSQARPGLAGAPFVLRKFRTMRPLDGNEVADVHSDARRLTDFGRFLRSTSLDELPELWNVLIGEMSLVGPRPLLLEYLPLYSDRQARRMEVRPGITGWAQVNGRNTVKWSSRLEMDVWYVDHRSFSLDLRILRMTISAVVRRKGVTSESSDTMERFQGET